MTLEEAFQIVYDLASQNILPDGEVAHDPEVLGTIQAKQQRACDTLHDFIVNVICEEPAGF